jgi:hypothetical protein
MHNAQIAAQLSAIAARLEGIETRLAARVSEAEIRRAMHDVLDTLGLVVQLKELKISEREQLAILVGLAAELLSEARTHEQARQATQADAGTQVDDRSLEIMHLLVQLRELGRKHVAGLYDLERAIEAQRATDRAP